MEHKSFELTEVEVAASRTLVVRALIDDTRAAAAKLDRLEQLVDRARTPSSVSEAPLDAEQYAELEEKINQERAAVQDREDETRRAVKAMSAWTPVAELLGTDLEEATLSVVQAHADRALGRFSTIPDHVEGLTWIVLEALVAAARPKELDWVESKEEALAEGTAILLGASVEEARTLLESLGRAHRRAVRRIAKDAMPPGAQLSIGAFALTVGLAMPGSEAVGSFIGTHFMGLHGAAATSAGLAALGGGSLASGGFGMAGGSIVAGFAMKGVETSAHRIALAQTVSRYSSASVIRELASLDVRASRQPSTQAAIHDYLSTLADALRADWESIRPRPQQRRGEVWRRLSGLVDDPTSIKQTYASIRDVLPSSVERNLATSTRAVEAELRHLSSPDWKRHATKVPRFMGVPSAGKLIDLAEETVKSWDADRLRSQDGDGTTGRE